MLMAKQLQQDQQYIVYGKMLISDSGGGNFNNLVNKQFIDRMAYYSLTTCC